MILKVIVILRTSQQESCSQRLWCYGRLWLFKA